MTSKPKSRITKCFIAGTQGGESCGGTAPKRLGAGPRAQMKTNPGLRIRFRDKHPLGHNGSLGRERTSRLEWHAWWRGRVESERQGLNLSGSWQQGHSATYNTPSRI